MKIPATAQLDSPMLVEEFLEKTAARFPEKTALISDGRRISYAELESESNRMAHGLQQCGVVRGDRVAVYLENSLETVVAIFAILKAGAVIVIVNPASKIEKLKYIFRNSEAKLLITDSKRFDGAKLDLQEIPGLQSVVVIGHWSRGEASLGNEIYGWDNLLSENSDHIRPPHKSNIDIDIAALIYTSGSTGIPKGVIMTHLSMVAATRSVNEYLGNNADDIILNVLPLSSSYGLYQVLMAFKIGATVVLERSFVYANIVVQRLLEERVSGFAMVPTIAAMLLQLDLTKYRFPFLRYITNAGAALPIQHVLRLRKVLPSTKLYLMYGLTECKRVSYLSPDEVDRRPNSVGKAIPNTEAYIVDEKGDRLPSGQIGELVVRGSNVMKGYWRLPEETAKMLKAGRLPGEQILYTGDLFRMDSDGYLYWIGRKDEIIKSRGEKVSPTEVENVIYDLPAVHMAAVIGVPDAVFGQAVKAVISIKPGTQLTRNEVLRHCRRHLEAYMVPTVVEFRDTIPRTPAGKVDKQQMLESKQENP
jgi:long-chain acyl-CoA synthetase